MINLKLLGEFKITFKGTDVTTKLSKKGIGLLLYMATQPGKLFYREQLSGVFWANYRKDSALNNLRYTLWQIRKIAKETGIENLFISCGKHAIKITPGIISCDYLDFINSNKSGKYLEASKLYTGDFLESFYLADVPDFSDWVFNERESVQRIFFDVQLHFADTYAGKGDLKGATDSLNRLIDIDPLNESVYYKLINYHYLSGNKVTAINTYRNLKQVLRDELNISPSEEIQRLFHTIVEENESVVISNETPIVSKAHITDNTMQIFVDQQPEKLNRYAKQLSEYKNTDNQLVLDICDSPGMRINYEGLFEILDDLNEYGKYATNNYKEKFNEIASEIKNTRVSEDLFLFNQFETLLKNEVSKTHVFRVWNLHFLDAKTIDFLAYVYRKKSDKQIIIAGVCDDSWNNERLEGFFRAYGVGR